MTYANTVLHTSTPSQQRHQRILGRHHDFHGNWWTTSQGSTFLPSTTSSTFKPTVESTKSSEVGSGSASQTPSIFPPSGSSTNVESIFGSSSTTITGSTTLSVSTTTFPATTITQPDTTFTSFSESFVTVQPSSTISFTVTTTAAYSSSSSTGEIEARSSPVCLGKGLDAAADGILAAFVVPSVIGLIIWLIFAILRPRFRQIYGLREWFVQQDLRPKPLGSSLLAFLFPHVPLVPSIPTDVSNAGRSLSGDAELFPSDEQLNQRVLWVSFLIVLSWSVIGLAGALPLYIISIPCNAELPPSANFGGFYSTLQDLSLLRLLRMFDAGNVATKDLNSIGRRAVSPDPVHSRERIIALTVIAIALGLFPPLWKIIKEFNAIVAFRQRWLDVKCEKQDLGWLSANEAPGFVGWGEKRLKKYIAKIGLSSSMGNHAEQRNGGHPNHRDRRTRKSEEQPLNHYESAEVDIQSLFSICDTHHLALLIDERDEILENLEIAETRYIASFCITTPDPSVLEFQPPPPIDPSRPYISRPLPLGPQIRTQTGRRRRAVNRAFAASSLAPTSFVGPSSYYKLRNVAGVSGGRFTDSGIDQSLGDSINSRVIGSRFLEVNRNSVAYGRLPIGSHVVVEKSGQLGPASPHDSWLPPIPDPRLYGPNYVVDSTDNIGANEYGALYEVAEEPEVEVEGDWVDLKMPMHDHESVVNELPAGPSSFRLRPQKTTPVPSARRETFPLRRDGEVEPESIQPPHLRLQPSQPFVRPQGGLTYDDLGLAYADITQWRSRLKAINTEITEAQAEGCNDIADGSRVKGWLVVGRGLRFIRGIQLIEGRAKEDIRWDVLQNERNWMDSVMLILVVVMVVVLLAAGITAASGLALSMAPDFSHYLPFLQPLLTAHPLAAGIATVFVPAVAVTVFIALALVVVNWTTKIYGSISVSGNQYLIFRITFFILVVVGSLWIITVGALLFALPEFSASSGEAQGTATGSIYMSVLALAIITNVAIIFPGLLLLQPIRLWRALQSERHAITPRQRFRAVYPRTYNPSFAIGTCVLAIVFASTFALIFPLIGPAVVLLLLLSLIAHRYLVGYVYARTHSQTGGLLQIWLLKRFGTLLSLQPILLGLIFLSRQIWIEGGVLVGCGAAVIIFVEAYAAWKTRVPGYKSLSPITRNSLETFASAADSFLVDDEEGTNSSSARSRGQNRGSMASVLEMMSLTLAVEPSASNHRGPVPLYTETLDDLTATERAARTHPDAPPHLPPLPFTDHAQDMAGILYAPELIAPPPIIWLPNDSAGVARSEAMDLQKYHNLQVTLDVHAKEEVLPGSRRTG